MKPYTEKDIEQVAKAFSVGLQRAIDRTGMEKTILQNRQYAKEYKPFCATHEFCDPNVCIDEAMKLLGFLGRLDEYEFHDLWNKAWAMAKVNEFYYSVPEYFIEDKSGRGAHATQDALTIRANWELSDYDSNSDLSLEEFLDNSEVGDEWSNDEEPAETIKRIR